MGFMQLHRIIVGVDGSASSKKALDWAIGLGDSFGAEIVAVHAIGLLAHLAPGRVVPAASHREELEQALASWTAPLRQEARPHRVLMVDGEPATAILDVAAKEGAELIVVGSRGMGNSRAPLLGSTANHVVQMADRPVLVATGETGNDDG